MYYEALAAGAGGDWWHVIILQAPLGATINVTDGDEDIDVVGTGNPMAIPVHNENSTYDITINATGFQWTDQFNTTSVSGGYEFIDIDYGTIHLTFDDEFRGLTLTVSDGGSNTGTFTAPATGNTVDVFVPALGSWTISGTVGGKQYNSKPVTISDYEVAQSTKLILVPVGKTVLPTDDIETWLLCGEIKDKNYTTLDEVLADEATLIKLLTNDNAIDYMKRSTTWIANPGLVPKLSSDANTLSDNTYTGYYAWNAFDDDDSTFWCCTATTGGSHGMIGYDFQASTSVRQLRLKMYNSTGYTGSSLNVKYSDDNVNWTSVGTGIGVAGSEVTINLPDSGAHRYWAVYLTDTTGTNLAVLECQFYGKTCSLTESETAMKFIGAYDYAADELLDDVTWNAAIMASEYWEKVFNATVPIMTSDTTPFGKAFSHTVFGAGNEAYKAFDGSDTGTRYRSETADTNSYIGYDFGFPVDVKKVKFTSFRDAANASTPTNIVTFNVQGIDGDGNRDVVSNTLGGATLNTGEGIVNTNGNKYNKYLIQNLTTYGTSVFELQFYGRATGSVQGWLLSAGIAKPYTTMEEILNDHETLATLITDHDSVDYLVTAKNLIADIVTDETAMRYIGKRNYASNSLLADDEWTKAICNSEYWKSVISSENPIMTGPTTPSGEAIYAIGNTGGEVTTFPPYCAFNGNTSSGGGVNWNSVKTLASANCYIGYDFGRPVDVRKFDLLNITYRSSTGSGVWVIKASNDKTNWVDASSDLTIPQSSSVIGGITTTKTKYRYWAFYTKSISSAIAMLIGDSKFYFREDIDETKITIRGASGANIYYKNAGVNVPIDTLDATTCEVEVLRSALSAIPGVPGRITLYSDVAADIHNDAQPYSKDILINDNTIDIDVMPDGAMYWFGKKTENFEELSTSNGWSGGTIVAPIYAQTYINCYSSSAGFIGLNSKKEKRKGILSTLITSKTLSGGASGYAYKYPQKGAISSYEEYVGFTNAANTTQRWWLRHFDDKMPMISRGAGAGCQMYISDAFMIEPNPAANFFGAANDTVYYLDGGIQVVFCQTNDLGEAVVDWSKFPDGTYTLYSSVAKDPANLATNAPFQKDIEITSDMSYEKFYHMPNGEVLYWYGYVGKNAETLSEANGWFWRSDFTFVNPTFGETFINLASSSGKTIGIGSKIKVTGILKAIAQGATASSSNYGQINDCTDKGNVLGSYKYYTLFDSTSMKLYSVGVVASYVTCSCSSGRVSNAYAFWVE